MQIIQEHEREPKERDETWMITLKPILRSHNGGALTSPQRVFVQEGTYYN